jgi:CelD/BcsL family acetyltransferase involved in cellulose biosynthesis
MAIDYALKFRLGEFTLLSVPLALEERSTGVIDLAAAPEDVNDIERSIDGVLFRSAEVTGQSPAINVGRTVIRYSPYRFRRYFLDLTGDFEGYLQKFSSKSRSTLRRKVRKFEAQSGGKADWRLYRTPEELTEFHRMARALSVRTYQEQLLDAGLPDDAAFRSEMLDRAKHGTALGFLLFLDGKPVAYLYTPVDDGVVVYAYLGYDQAVSNLSPGTVLQLLAVEWLFAEGGYKSFDFTEGEGAHKAFFSTRHAECADVFVLRNTARLRLIVRAHWMTNQGSDALVRVVDSLGLKKRIKKLIRRRAAERSSSPSTEPAA